MKKAIVGLVVLAFVARGLGDTMTMERVRSLSAGQAGARGAGHVVYDNTVAPWSALALNPGAWIGDDLNLDMSGAPGNILNDISFSIYHGSSGSAGLLNTCDVDLLFYDLSDSSYVGALTFSGLQPGLRPGYFATYQATDLGAHGIALPGDLFIMMRIYNVTGGATKVGQVLCDPPTIGSSSMDFYLDDRNADPPGLHYGWYYFANPNGNFYWGIGVIPEPATLLGLMLGGSLLRRRR
jgi:hypothetical protein